MKTVEMLRIYLIVCFSLIAVIPFSLHAKTIYYVTATGTGDGSSWANAASNIQLMIDKAVATDEVWVAKGTYFPTNETIARDARSKTFLVKAGVNLYGGFAGTESAIYQRKFADLDNNGKIDSWEFANSTVLSGNIDGVEDIWTKTVKTDGKSWYWTVSGNIGNSYNVVSGGSVDTSINGFTVVAGNATSDGGGIYSSSNVNNCTISNCSASRNGGGIYTSSLVSNCAVTNCKAGLYGGGIYSYSTIVNTSSSISNCSISNCSVEIINGGGIYTTSSTTYTGSFTYVNNCLVLNCSAGYRGGGIFSSASTNPNTSTISATSSIASCYVLECSAGDSGGGIFSSYSFVTNCTVSNCSADDSGGGIYSSSTNNRPFLQNCIILNCSAVVSGGGIYSASSYSVSNCASSNNYTATTIDSGVFGANQGSYISPNIYDVFVQPTNFIGITTTDAQKFELLKANWQLKEGSVCINAGKTTSILGTFNNNLRALYGIIDIGAFEYTINKVTLPIYEEFNNWTNFEKSELFYCSAKLNTLNEIKWIISNQKALFNWQTNLTSTYSQPFFTYQIDATKTSKVFLRYDMYYEAYAGTVSPLGTEKLNVEFSTDFINWSSITTYSNAIGTIASKNYLHDISTKAAGRTFFIRFNANGVNSNRIEKWEIDNVVIDTDGISAVNTVQENKYKYSINNGDLIISNLEIGAGIQLFDINGKLFKTINAESQIARLTLPVRGVYLIKVSSVSGVENKKMVW